MIKDVSSKLRSHHTQQCRERLTFCSADNVHGQVWRHLRRFVKAGVPRTVDRQLQCCKLDIGQAEIGRNLTKIMHFKANICRQHAHRNVRRDLSQTQLS